MPNNKAPTSSRQAVSAPEEQPIIPAPHFLETLLDRPIAFHCVFAELTQSLSSGIMLSQAIYWSKRTKDANGWFYKKQAEWKAEIYLSRYEQESARACLRAQGTRRNLPPFWLEERRGLPAKIFYRIDFEALSQHLSALHQEYAEIQQSEDAVEPDLTGLSSRQSAEKPHTRLRKTSNLDGGKPANRKETFPHSGSGKSGKHSITETTTQTTHNNGRGVRVLEEKPKTRSAFTIKEWLTYAKTQPNINNKMAFANAMARTPDNDSVMELHLENERQETALTPTPGCEKCQFTGWEHVPGKGVKPCGCRLAQAQ